GRAVWPAVLIAGVFVATALLDLWSYVPGWLHLAGIGAFAILFLYVLWRGARGVRFPTADDGERRLERASVLAHRPLTTLTDRQASGIEDPVSAALWRVHRRRMLAKVRRLRVGWPSLGLARRDQRAFRAAVGLLLLIAIVGSGGDSGSRLSAALTPNLSESSGLTTTFEAWITPPEYTGFPPVFLTAPDKRGQLIAARQLEIPTGSTFIARLSGGRTVPAVAIDGAETQFETIDARHYQIDVKIEHGEKLAIRRGGDEIATWRMTVISDLPPKIAFVDKPKITVRRAIEIAYAATDDYGLTGVKVVVARAENDETFELDLPLPGNRLRKANEKSFHDLTAHPWAGLKVKLHLTATDARGQLGASAPIAITLPEREFTHPIARALVEQRKNLARDPATRDKVATALNALSLMPERYNGDTTVHLALQSARARLKYDRSEVGIKKVQDLLWDTATRLEDGNLSLAQQQLREAQQALNDALARNAPDEEIQKLMQQLREVMEKYLQALMDQARQRAEQGGEGNLLDQDTTQLQEFDLKEMLRRAEELSRMGARDAARQLLSQLQQMLENLRAGVMPSQRQQGGQQAMLGLNDLMRQQQQLLDQTFRSQQRGRPEGGESYDGLSGKQNELRRMLGEIMRQLGEAGIQIPNTMGRAERQMRDSREALGRQSPGAAVRSQSNALDLLREGASQIFRSLMAQGDTLDGDHDYGQMDPEAERDPFGRMNDRGTAVDDSRVKIPDKADSQRARDILEELYRRSAERSRSQVELEYIDRLLKRF
ncbi:MAG: TIGR02302 family protein, partial [Alphaproteobacteria bacterium]|nr:TIGR02302 family protein [Alphaproteobacteria bacterium]